MTFAARHDSADRHDHRAADGARPPRRRRPSPAPPAMQPATAIVTVEDLRGPSVSGSPVQTLIATRTGTPGRPTAALAAGTYTAQAVQLDSVGNTGTSASTFTIVAPPAGPTNQAPTCTDGTKTVPNATPTAITLTCTDSDGDPLTLSIVAPPGHGTLGTIASGSVTYTPTSTYSGSDTFTFKRRRRQGGLERRRRLDHGCARARGHAATAAVAVASSEQVQGAESRRQDARRREGRDQEGPLPRRHGELREARAGPRRAPSSHRAAVPERCMRPTL